MCLSNQIVSCFNRVKSLLTKYFRVRTYKANIIENHLSSLTIQYREKAYWHLFPPHFGIHTKQTFGHISYEIKKVRFSKLLIFEKNGLVWPADIWPAHNFKY